MQFLAPSINKEKYSSVLNCTGGRISKGLGVPEKYIKMGGGEGVIIK